MANLLEQLRTMTSVVADTGDVEAILKHRPDDATTNPSLLLKAVDLPHYRTLLDQAVKAGDGNVEVVCDRFATLVGGEILQVIEGYVSTEVDARLSFDTAATVSKAKQIIEYYEAAGIARDRILIKIAATWEGIQAAAELEQQGIQCNLTLLFSFAQARACADAGATLISPFVGRIYDWYKRDRDVRHIDPIDDPGVKSVAQIYEFYKRHGFRTIVMGASFRHIGQITALAGCDKLTIAPNLLQELAETEEDLQRALPPHDSEPEARPAALTEAEFRWMLNEDAMATEKLAEGIRTFAADQIALERIVKRAIQGDVR
ncbi:transaldolase [Allohahella sp. A8]|uniref:transaldolase n=1 Tax=Allohahella sp. A8 TaxID=3141461 RepID=UPI000C0AFE83|nr:transaldolase [Hahellaceae bacterium]